MVNSLSIENLLELYDEDEMFSSWYSIIKFFYYLHQIWIFKFIIFMYLRRDHLIKKQLKINKSSDSHRVEKETLRKIEGRALEQLTMNRIKSR